MARSPTSAGPVADDAFAEAVADDFRSRGYSVEPRLTRVPAPYDFAASKGNLRCAVRVRDLKGKAELNAVTVFGAFMDTSEGRPFHLGYFVTPRGLTKSAASFIADNPQFRLKHLTRHGHAFHQIAGASDTKPFHVGVFTFKGGVGKTKLSLLLACALAHRGHNAVLVDLNRAQNLHNLVGPEGVYVRNERGLENVVSVFGRDEWNIKQNKWKIGKILDASFFLYDCPQFFEKPSEREAIAHLDLVLSPITLTVDSIGVNHAVLRDTLAEVRARNPAVAVEFVLNVLREEQLKGPMLAHLRATRAMFAADGRSALLHPEKYFVPYSSDLERLGSDRALDPASALGLVFSAEVESRQPWVRRTLMLADHMIQLARRPTRRHAPPS